MVRGQSHPQAYFGRTFSRNIIEKVPVPAFGGLHSFSLRAAEKRFPQFLDPLRYHFQEAFP